MCGALGKLGRRHDGFLRLFSHQTAPEVRKIAKCLALLETGSYDPAASQRVVEGLVKEAPPDQART